MPRPLVLAAGSMLDCTASQVVAVAAEAGFDGLGLRITGQHGGEETTVVRAYAAECGVTIHDTEVHRIGAGTDDPTELLDRSVELGAQRVLVVSDLDDRDRTRQEVTRLSELCRDRSLLLGLEYMAWTDPSDPIEAAAVARESGCVLVVDLLHHVRVGCGPEELEAIVDSGTLGWVQLSDGPAHPPSDLLDEARHHRLPPGHGALRLSELLVCVPATTTISVEVQSDDLLATRPGERARLLHTAACAVLGDRP